MSFQEKKNLVSIAGTIFTFTIYCLFLRRFYLQLSPGLENLLKFWGVAAFVLIPTEIIPKIIIHIIFSIINRIATREEEPSFSDEMDKLIELKMQRNAFYTFALGFFLAMAAPLLGLSLSVMFMTMLTALIVTCIVGDLSAFYYYRRGV